jgi:2-keto-3-deoxy-L-rhamnonate aldolase RhmA
LHKLIPALVLVTAAFAQTAPVTNPVKLLLKAGKPVIGGTIQIPAPEVAAQVASMGFDFLWIEGEHSPITLETTRNMILATRGLKAVPFTRIPSNELWLAKRALDAGSLGVVFPFTSTPELAKQAVAACKYPPGGYADFADNNVMVIIIIEEARAVDNIDAIASTPGIDVLFIGTNDLSYSLGLRGNQNHPKHREAVLKVLAAGKKYGIPVGRPAATPESYDEGIKDGFLFFQGPADINLLANGVRALLNPIGKSADDPSKRPLY